MLASHHRQCELDQQLHGCPTSDSFNIDPCNLAPVRPTDMVMMQLLPHSMPANSGSLPSMPTCMPVPHYHPFPGALPTAPPSAVATICPLVPPCEHHIAGVPPYYPVWNPDFSYHEVSIQLNYSLLGGHCVSLPRLVILLPFNWARVTT